jgi:hypothetical protein
LVVFDFDPVHISSQDFFKFAAAVDVRERPLRPPRDRHYARFAAA